jgi:hypothetical protein
MHRLVYADDNVFKSVVLYLQIAVTMANVQIKQISIVFLKGPLSFQQNQNRILRSDWPTIRKQNLVKPVSNWVNEGNLYRCIDCL